MRGILRWTDPESKVSTTVAESKADATHEEGGGPGERERAPRGYHALHVDSKPASLPRSDELVRIYFALRRGAGREERLPSHAPARRNEARATRARSEALTELCVRRRSTQRWTCRIGVIIDVDERCQRNLVVQVLHSGASVQVGVVDRSQRAWQTHLENFGRDAIHACIPHVVGFGPGRTDGRDQLTEGGNGGEITHIFIFAFGLK